jgi:hypothetical protein
MNLPPLIDGAYAHIEGRLGAEFTEMFIQILDDVIVKLKPRHTELDPRRTEPKPQRTNKEPHTLSRRTHI